MNIEELRKQLDNYNYGETERAWTMSKAILHYENEYISVKRIDSSNKWIEADKMGKMWSIIIEQKKSFESLLSYRQLESTIDIDITPVTRGIYRGCYGIRLYNMKKEPNGAIIKMILDFIFNVIDN